MIFNKIQERLQPELDRMNDYISRSLSSSMPFLNKIVEPHTERKGKQIRPLIVLLSAELLGSITDEVLHAGASIELLHNATLIHDDVIDQSMCRRGLPTINAVWDNHIAVLTGDYFVSRSLDESVKAGSLEIVKMMSHLANVLSQGELHQIFVAREHGYSLRNYARTVEMKTAILFESCVRIGAESIHVSPEIAANLVKYAYYMGICFQIRDDIFDYCDDFRSGKPAGNDLREGKVTFPLLYALQVASEEERKEMKTLMNRESLSDEDIRRLTGFAVAKGGIEFSHEIMNRIREKAMRCLRTYPESKARRDLEDIFDFIINRDH